MIIKVTDGERIRISNSKLIIEREELSRELSLKDIRLVLIENLYSSISVKSMLELSDNKILTIICNEKHQPQLQVLDLYSNYKITERIKEQISWKAERKKQCFQKIITQKILNQRILLSHFSETYGAECLQELENKLAMNLELKSSEIKSLEGVAARIYFQKIFGEDFRRFSTDSVNSALDYGYTVLRTLIAQKIVAKGLHPTLGIDHDSIFNSFNLADDLIEVFRPLVDYIVYRNKLNYTELTKEYRNELLKMFFQELEYAGKFYTLDYVVERFADSLIKYLNESTDEIIFPKLVIANYEF